MNNNTNNNLSTETVKLIRSAIRTRLARYASDYKIRKVIKAALENPSSWSAGRESDTFEDCVQRYYRNINDVTATSIFIHFKNDMCNLFGIYA